MNSPTPARFRRSEEHSSFDFVQAVCGFAGLAGVRYRSLCVQRFSFQHFSFTQIPLFPHLRSGQPLIQRPPPQKQIPSIITGDFAIFQDEDGSIHHIAVRKPDKALILGRLSEDGLKPIGEYKVLEGVTIKTEAPAFFRRNGKVYLLGSGTSGWSPNPARMFVAEQLAGPYKELPNPCRGLNPINQLGPDKTFGGQSTFVYPVAGRKDAWIAMFDINKPEDPIHAGYIWLPIEFEGEQPVIRWRDQWNLSVFPQP